MWSNASFKSALLVATAITLIAWNGGEVVAQSSTDSDQPQAPAQQQMPGQMGQGMMQGQMGQGQMGQGMMSGQMGQGMMMGPGMMMPPMNSAHGRRLFAAKGCVVCHSINGIGGEDAPALDASTMSRGMNPFEFVAKMWRGAPAMIEMQNDELGSQVEFTGDELEDIIAFVHDEAEQQKFTKADIPPKIEAILDRAEQEEGESGKGGMDMGKMKMNQPAEPTQ
ncbi:MAG: c-type cytochrome [Dongiaceae bacterium]